MPIFLKIIKMILTKIITLNKSKSNYFCFSRSNRQGFSIISYKSSAYFDSASCRYWFSKCVRKEVSKNRIRF